MNMSQRPDPDHGGVARWRSDLDLVETCPTLTQVLATGTGSHDTSKCDWCAQTRTRREAPAGAVWRETVWCEAHGGLANPHVEQPDCLHPHYTGQHVAVQS